MWYICQAVSSNPIVLGNGMLVWTCGFVVVLVLLRWCGGAS